MEIARGDGNVEAMRGKVASGPFVIGCYEDGTHLGVLADFSADKVKGLGSSHRVKNVV